MFILISFFLAMQDNSTLGGVRNLNLVFVITIEPFSGCISDYRISRFWPETANTFSDSKDLSEVLTHKNSENKSNEFYFFTLATLRMQG